MKTKRLFTTTLILVFSCVSAFACLFFFDQGFGEAFADNKPSYIEVAEQRMRIRAEKRRMLEAQIANSRRLADQLQAHTDSLGALNAQIAESVERAEQDVAAKKKQFADAVKAAQSVRDSLSDAAVANLK